MEDRIGVTATGRYDWVYMPYYRFYSFSSSKKKLGNGTINIYCDFTQRVFQVSCRYAGTHNTLPYMR